MPKFLRILITVILIFFGIYLLGFNPDSPNVNFLTIMGIGCLLSAWALNSMEKTESKKGFVNLIQSEIMRDIKEFEKKLADQPSPHGKYQLAELYLKVGNLKKTIEVISQYLEDVPDNPHAQYLQMIAYFGLKEYSKAWEIIEKLYAQDEAFDEHKIKLWAARCYIELLEPENALKFVDMYMEKTGISAEAFYVKGIAYAKLGNKNNADTCLDELVKMHEIVPKMRKFEIKMMVKNLQKSISDISS